MHTAATGKQPRSPLHVVILLSLLAMTASHARSQPLGPDQALSRYFDALQVMGAGEHEAAIADLKHLISDFPEFSRAYKSIAEAYIYLNDLKAARRFFDSLLEQNASNPFAYYGLARIDQMEKDYTSAIRNLEQCLALEPRYVGAYGPYGGLPEACQAINDLHLADDFITAQIEADSMNASALYGLGRVHLKRNEWDKAVERLGAALRLEPDLALAHKSMVYIYEATGRYQQAVEQNEALLSAAERQQDPDMISSALLKRGGFCFMQGDYGQALRYFNRALKIAQRIGAKRREGLSLNNMAAVHAMSGNKQKALKYFEAALDLVRKMGVRRTEIRTLNNIGHVLKDQGAYDQALSKYQEALRIAQGAGYRFEEGLVSSSIAEVFEHQGESVEALKWYRAALTIARSIEDREGEAYTMVSLGRLYQKRGQFHAAIGHFREALEIGRVLNQAQIMWEAQAGLGRALRSAGRSAEAIQHYAGAIALYDSVRAKLGIESLGVDFLEDKFEAYPSIIEMMAESGRPGEAFLFAEKYKAKTLLDILSRGQMRLQELLPGDLRTRLKKVRTDLESAHSQLSRARAQPEADDQRLLSLDQQITDLKLKQASLIEEVRSSHTSYYQLTSSGPLGAEAIRTDVLQPGQALLEYVVGADRLSTFVLTSDTLIYHNAAVTRDSLVRLLRDFSSVFGRAQKSGQGASLAILNAPLAGFSIPPSFALYNILVEPIQSWLPAGGVVTIIPDDVLFYLPFETLVVDTAGVESQYDFGAARFMVEDYIISYALSASLLDPRLRRPGSPKRDLLALGNPAVRDEMEMQTDVELLASTRAPSGPPRDNALALLPHSETEVRRIGDVLSNSENQLLLGADATERRFKTEARDFRVLHLATHFLADDQQPLYSRIVLARGEESKEDGYLQTYEVFNLELNADLAVLSACNTGLGRLSRGEGLIGISRAFLYAGVPSLVVSLWSVDDAATSIIMQAFYGYLKSGLSKSRALRRAKLDYLEGAKPSRRDPFYWAPFVLIGDARPVAISDRSWHLTPLRAFVFFSALAALLVVIGRIAPALPWIKRKRRG